MEKLRVYQVAKEHGLSSDTLMALFKKMGVAVKSHMTVVTPEMLASIQTDPWFAKIQEEIKKASKIENSIYNVAQYYHLQYHIHDLTQALRRNFSVETFAEEVDKPILEFIKKYAAEKLKDCVDNVLPGPSEYHHWYKGTVLDIPSKEEQDGRIAFNVWLIFYFDREGCITFGEDSLSKGKEVYAKLDIVRRSLDMKSLLEVPLEKTETRISSEKELGSIALRSDEKITAINENVDPKLREPLEKLFRKVGQSNESNESALMDLQVCGELLIDKVLEHANELPTGSFADRIARAGQGYKKKKPSEKDICGLKLIPSAFDRYFDVLRKARNTTAHDRISPTSEELRSLLAFFLVILEWFYCEYEEGPCLSTIYMETDEEIRIKEKVKKEDRKRIETEKLALRKKLYPIGFENYEMWVKTLKENLGPDANIFLEKYIRGIERLHG